MRAPLPARPLLARRARERGAAVFVVMMAILLLSGIGMWSMHSASLVDRASGYERASLQAQYVAELGLVAASTYLSIPGMAAINYRLGEKAYASVGGDACESVPTASGPAFCKSLWQSDINDASKEATNQDLLADTAQGSLSAFENEVQGDFTVEVTSPRRAIVPGSPLNEDSPYRLVTLTSYGTVRPHTEKPVNGNLCKADGVSSSAQNSSAGRISVRAHAIIGPIE